MAKNPIKHNPRAHCQAYFELAKKRFAYAFISLNAKQQVFVQRRQSTLERINTPFPRPNKPAYQGQPHILPG